jgi:hypothetical protein
MIPIDKRIIDNTIMLYIKDFNSQRIEIKRNLSNLLKTQQKQMSKNEITFLKLIIKELRNDQNNLLIEYDLDSVINRIGPIPESKLKVQKSNKTLTLKDLIVLSFKYDELRGDFYPKFYSEIGIKTCVYCNSQLAVSVLKNKYPQQRKGRKKALYSLGEEYSAKYQLDHNRAKDKYPYLAACVFNLYPSCATCNNIKRTTNVDFELYSTTLQTSKYKFSLDRVGKAHYLNGGGKENLKIIFTDPDKPNPNIKSEGSFEDTFHISSIYNTQIDLVEELIFKKKVYDKVYKDIYKNCFKAISFDIEIAIRSLIGNYIKPEDIHKRPMSKFIQDISDDIDFKIHTY